jgi:hypothetical protein
MRFDTNVYITYATDGQSSVNRRHVHPVRSGHASNSSSSSSRRLIYDASIIDDES